MPSKPLVYVRTDDGATLPTASSEEHEPSNDLPTWNPKWISGSEMALFLDQ
jgi:hypothetical protein